MSNADASTAGWGRLREPGIRALVWTCVVSVLAHLLLTPLAALLGVFASLSAPPEDDGPVEQLRAIPITFLGYEELPEPPPPVPPPTAPAVVMAPSEAPKLAPPEPKPEVKQTAGKEEPPKPAPPPADAARRGDIAHPVAMSGVSAQIVDSNANVNLLLMTERVREHPLGERIGKLLINFPQWSSFFESAEVDPVRDVNRILLVGPQFRRSADVVAILQHRLPEKTLKGAVDRLVQRPPKGRWLRSKMPVAVAHADRAQRLFALTAPDVLVVAPPQLQESLMAAPPTKFPTPPGDEALVLHVRTPWRALMGLPFRLPESLAWLRLDVQPLANGGAQLRVTAEDASAEEARSHADSLTVALNALTNPDLGALGALVGLKSIAFIDRMQLVAEDKVISGQVTVSPRQMQRLLTYAEELIVQWTGQRHTEPSRLGSGGAPPPAPATGSRRPRAAGGQPGELAPSVP